MFKRSLIPVWIGIILLSGMFLMGQDTWQLPCKDHDGDGYGRPASELCTYSELDCNNLHPGVNPGATEGPYGDPTCSDTFDNDCDGDVDIDDSACCECIDNDGDGYGDPGCENCTYPEIDCLDSNPDANPGETEGPEGDPTCSDGFDNDCDGNVDLDDEDCVTDLTSPHVVATNIPVGGELGFNNRDLDLTIMFNEPMDCNGGTAFLNAVGFKSLGPLVLTQSFNEPTCDMLTLDPLETLPVGMQILVELLGFVDDSGNAYNGLINGTGNPDVFTANAPAFAVPMHGGVATGFITSGDPTLLQATNFRQTPATVDPGQPVGGKSGNISTPNQANNLNVLDPDCLLDLSVDCPGQGNGILGDDNNETDNMCFAWTAPSGSPRQYNLYAEYLTGGIPGGLPVLVGQTMKSADPPTSLCVRVRNVCTAMSNAGLPNFCADNGSTRYLDNGMTFQAAVTTVNSNAQEGPFSNVVSAGDVTPPTMADQGEGFDTSPFDPVNGTAPTFLAIYALTSAYGGFPPPDIDLEVLDEIGGLPADNLYNAADWIAFAGAGDSIILEFSEDLDGSQDMSGIGSLTTSGPAYLIATAIPGTGSNRRTVVASLIGIPLLSPGDVLSIEGILDEARNAGEGDASVILGDLVSPLFTNGIAVDNGTDPDQLVLNVTEPLDETTAENIGNYYSNGTINLAGSTVNLDTAGTQVTIEAPADGGFGDVIVGYQCSGLGLDIAPNNRIAMPGVEDLNGNVGVPASVLSFQVADQIAPRIVSSATVAGPINVGAPATDGRWNVGDGSGASENYSLLVFMSEPVIWDVDCDGSLNQIDAVTLGISGELASVNPGTYFGIVASMGSPTGTDPYSLEFDFQGTGTALVAQGDRFRVIGVQDLSGNSVNSVFDTIELEAATSGYSIN